MTFQNIINYSPSDIIIPEDNFYIPKTSIIIFKKRKQQRDTKYIKQIIIEGWKVPYHVRVEAQRKNDRLPTNFS